MEEQTSGALNYLASLEFNLLQISVLFFVMAVLVNLAFWFVRNEKVGKVSWLFSLTATVVLTASLVVRWIHVGHIPYIRLYETFLFVSWSIAILAVITDQVAKSRLPTSIANLVAAILLIYIVQWPETSREGFRLQAALQSPWLDSHIATCFLAYAGFAISAGAAVVYLFNRKEKIDELSYRLVAFAFPLLALGIILGAVWAREAWGSYWEWDPKETAALVSWLVYAGYLHARLVLNWKGVKAAIFNLVGFACVIFTWVGLNFVNVFSNHTYSG